MVLQYTSGDIIFLSGLLSQIHIDSLNNFIPQTIAFNLYFDFRGPYHFSFAFAALCAPLFRFPGGTFLMDKGGFSSLLLFFPFFVRALILSPLSRVMGNVYVFSRIKVYVFSRIKATSSGSL